MTKKTYLLPELKQGTFIKRYKRFLVDVIYDHQELTIHCPNTGSMHGLLIPSTPVWFSTSTQATRKYPHTLEIIQTPSANVGVNTHRANSIVHTPPTTTRTARLRYNYQNSA